MLNHLQLRELIIKPTLDLLQLYSDNAVELLVFTCAVESDGGTYLKQIKGPAVGIYQMEPATYNDIWQNYIRNRNDLINIIGLNFGIFKMPSEDRMIYDLQFATVMARLFYRRINAALPPCNDIVAMYKYYKLYYNTPLGKSTEEESIAKYLKFIGKPQPTPSASSKLKPAKGRPPANSIHKQ